MEPIDVNIPLNAREQAGVEKYRRLNRLLARMPQCLFGLTIRAGLAKSRVSSHAEKGIEAKPKNAVKKRTVTLDAGYGTFQAHIYQRENLLAGQHPLFCFIHGGGFIGGDALRNENLLMRLADELDVVCASVDYHPAPELRFPGAIRECAFTVRELLETRGLAPFLDREKIIVAGDSAGGNLAIGTAATLLQADGITPRAVVLLYPVTEMYKMNTPSYLQNEPEYRGMRKFIKVCRRLYTKSQRDYQNVLFSPLLAQADPRPEAAGKYLLLLAGKDGLLDDGKLYADLLRSRGADVRTVIYLYAYHAFINELGDSNVAEHAFGEIADCVGSICNP